MTAVQVYNQVWGRGSYALHISMRRRADMYSTITIIFSYKFKIVNEKAINNRKTKPIVETKTAQYVHMMILNCTLPI